MNGRDAWVRVQWKFLKIGSQIVKIFVFNKLCFLFINDIMQKYS